MKKHVLIIIAILITGTSFAQKISIKNGIIYKDTTKFVTYTASKEKTLAYTISTPGGIPLITMRPCRYIERKGKAVSYVITFLNDQGKAMLVLDQPETDTDVIIDLIKQGLIKNNAVDIGAEDTFTGHHRMPDLYNE